MYQVWIQAEYEETWKLTECPDIAAVEEIIRANFGKEVKVKVSMPVEFDAGITVKVHAPEDKTIRPPLPLTTPPEIKQEVKSEAAEDKAEPDKDTRGKGHGKVR